MTGDRQAIAAAVREADYTLGQLGPGKTDIVACGMWTGMAASSVLEPMVLLYRRTGEPRYLDFGQLHRRAQWQTPRGPDLVKALAGMPVYDMFPGPDKKQPGYMSGGSWKAYETMSCFKGLLELYRVTGKSEYLQAVRKVAAGIRDTEITVIGSGSSWERWCRGHFAADRAAAGVDGNLRHGHLAEAQRTTAAADRRAAICRPDRADGLTTRSCAAQKPNGTC